MHSNYPSCGRSSSLWRPELGIHTVAPEFLATDGAGVTSDIQQNESSQHAPKPDISLDANYFSKVPLTRELNMRITSLMSRYDYTPRTFHERNLEKWNELIDNLLSDVQDRFFILKPRYRDITRYLVDYWNIPRRDIRRIITIRKKRTDKTSKDVESQKEVDQGGEALTYLSNPLGVSVKLGIVNDMRILKINLKAVRESNRPSEVVRMTREYITCQGEKYAGARSRLLKRFLYQNMRKDRLFIAAMDRHRANPYFYPEDQEIFSKERRRLDGEKKEEEWWTIDENSDIPKVKTLATVLLNRHVRDSRTKADGDGKSRTTAFEVEQSMSNQRSHKAFAENPLSVSAEILGDPLPALTPSSDQREQLPFDQNTYRMSLHRGGEGSNTFFNNDSWTSLPSEIHVDPDAQLMNHAGLEAGWYANPDTRHRALATTSFSPILSSRPTSISDQQAILTESQSRRRYDLTCLGNIRPSKSSTRPLGRKCRAQQEPTAWMEGQ